jgi:tripartite-type tricarboxylate transporter receptor subunit TctC
MQRIFILLWLSWGLVGAAGAQKFSSRPVMIVAFSAGGPADIVARKAQTLNVLQPSMSGLIKAYAATTPQRGRA